MLRECWYKNLKGRRHLGQAGTDRRQCNLNDEVFHYIHSRTSNTSLITPNKCTVFIHYMYIYHFSLACFGVPHTHTHTPHTHTHTHTHTPHTHHTHTTHTHTHTTNTHTPPAGRTQNPRPVTQFLSMVKVKLYFVYFITQILY